MKYASFKKLMAVAMAMVMVVSTPAMTKAADTESTDGDTSATADITGTGSVEDYIDKDVFKIVLPTVSNVNFTLDPQGLLKVADSTNYTLGEGAVYFTNVGESSNTYSDTSDAIKIINKSSYDIDVDFSVEVTMPEGVTLVEDEGDLANATTPSVYLAMKEAGDNDEVALKTGTNTYETKQADAVPEVGGSVTKGYEITATGSAGSYTYKYELTSSFTNDDADAVEYTLTGACDSKADWSKVKDKDITAKVVWSAEKHVEGPVITFTNDGKLTIEGLSEDYVFVSVKLPYTSNGKTATYEFNTTATTWSPSMPTTSSTGTFTAQLNDAWKNLLKGTTSTVTLTYTDKSGGSDETKTVTSTAVFEQ